MKIRNGFVSNSSSSSFIIQGRDTSFPYDTIELNASYKGMLKRQGIPIDVTKEIYLSKMISDGCDWDFEYQSNWNDYKDNEGKKFNIFEYIEYGSRNTIEIEDGFSIDIICDNKTDVELNIFKLLERSLQYES